MKISSNLITHSPIKSAAATTLSLLDAIARLKAYPNLHKRIGDFYRLHFLAKCIKLKLYEILFQN